MAYRMIESGFREEYIPQMKCEEVLLEILVRPLASSQLLSTA